MRRARQWSANVVVAVGAIGVVAAADRQPGAVERGIGTLAGLVAVLGAVRSLDHVVEVRSFSHMIDPRRWSPAS
jgi:hypothetical protein